MVLQCSMIILITRHFDWSFDSTPFHKSVYWIWSCHSKTDAYLSHSCVTQQLHGTINTHSFIRPERMHFGTVWDFFYRRRCRCRYCCLNLYFIRLIQSHYDLSAIRWCVNVLLNVEIMSFFLQNIQLIIVLLADWFFSQFLLSGLMSHILSFYLFFSPFVYVIEL